MMHDFRALRLRYDAASDAHRAIAAEHARRSVENNPPSADELMLERRTREELEAASRALLAALGGSSPAHRPTPPYTEGAGRTIVHRPEALLPLDRCKLAFHKMNRYIQSRTRPLWS